MIIHVTLLGLSNMGERVLRHPFFFAYEESTFGISLRLKIEPWRAAVGITGSLLNYLAD
jgi:hypothetical protein